MKKILSIVILILLFSQLGNVLGTDKKNAYKYQNKEDGKNLYVVDSIEIKNPIVIITDKDYHFVMSKDTYDQYNGKEKFFFDRPDVYFLGYMLPSKSMDSEQYFKYNNDIERFEYKNIQKDKNRNIEAYSYIKAPDYFLLLLVRGDYYNRCYIGIDGAPSIDFKNHKFNYYKVAIACRKNNNPKSKITPKYYSPTSVDSLIAK